MCEYAWTSIQSPSKIFRYSVLNEKNKIHPTQKPVKLYEWILQNYAKEGDNIFDSHLGSASSVIACYNLGFDITGCELDKDYFEAANKRVNTHISQCNLLIEEPQKEIILPQNIELF